jgi:hypothetical protein
MNIGNRIAARRDEATEPPLRSASRVLTRLASLHGALIVKRFARFMIFIVGATIAASVRAENDIVIRGITVIDGTGRAPIVNAAVVIEGSRIKEVGQHVRPPVGARTIDGSGKFLIPGLIDTHGASARWASCQRLDVRC